MTRKEYGLKDYGLCEHGEHLLCQLGRCVFCPADTTPSQPEESKCEFCKDELCNGECVSGLRRTPKKGTFFDRYKNDHEFQKLLTGERAKLDVQLPPQAEEELQEVGSIETKNGKTIISGTPEFVEKIKRNIKRDAVEERWEPAPHPQEQWMEEFDREFFTTHDGCDDGFYACPKSEDYFGQYEDKPIEERPCYCPVENTKPKLKSFLTTQIEAARREERGKVLAAIEKWKSEGRDSHDLWAMNNFLTGSGNYLKETE